MKKGSLADVTDNYGRSTFFYACVRGNVKIIKHLSCYNVATTIINSYSATLLFAATQNGYKKVVAHLLAIKCSYGSLVDGFNRTLL